MDTKMFKVPAAISPGEELDRFMMGLKRRNPGESEFIRLSMKSPRILFPLFITTLSTKMPIFLNV